MAYRRLAAGFLACLVFLLAGCPKGNENFKAGKKAELLQDYDTALIHYERALKEDPANVEYKLKTTRIRFEASQAHVDQGQKFRDKGELQLALAEFEKAAAIDHANVIAGQELRRTLEMLAAARAPVAGAPGAEKKPEEPKLMEQPPDLMPLSR